MWQQTIGRALCITAIVIMWGCGGGNKQPAAAAAAGIAAVVEPLIASVVNSSFVVPPRNFAPFEFVVGEEMVNARFEGTFSASGANNDIEMLLLEESQFKNWQNGHKFRSTYESGRVTADKVRLDLTPAKYFVIFSNRFSIFSNKAVTADMKLRYDRAR